MAAAGRSPVTIGYEKTTMSNGQIENPVQQLAQLSGLSDMQNSEPQPTSLLTIPRELRDEIYNHLLKPDRRVSINLFPYDEATRAFLALSGTCKQTRIEAAELFFKNDFVWTVSSIPHYSCELHIHRMRQLELMLDTKELRSEIIIIQTAVQLSVFWDQQLWTMPITFEGRVQMHPSPNELSSGWEVDLRRRYGLIQAFHRLVVRGPGMNIEALNVLGDELRERGWSCVIAQADR